MTTKKLVNFPLLAALLFFLPCLNSYGYENMDDDGIYGDPSRFISDCTPAPHTKPVGVSLDKACGRNAKSGDAICVMQVNCTMNYAPNLDSGLTREDFLGTANCKGKVVSDPKLHADRIMCPSPKECLNQMIPSAIAAVAQSYLESPATPKAAAGNQPQGTAPGL